MQSVRAHATNNADLLSTITCLAVKTHLSSTDIELACAQLRLSRSRIYHLIERFRSGGADAFPGGFRKPGLRKGTRLVDTRVDVMLDEVLQTQFLTRLKPKVSRIMRLLGVEAKKRGLKCPSRGTVQDRINKLDPRHVVQAREGTKAAGDKFRPVLASYTATRPLQLVQVDHTLADVIVVDEETRRPLQRPWLTVLIDVCTRMVAGYYLSLDPPSTTSVALALEHAVLPKDEWLKQRGLDTSWPVCGLPEALHMDNAKEFHSIALTKGLRDHGIRYVYRPVRQPHFGGHIERFIGTIMWGMHDLPGTTFSNIKERGTYQSEKQSSLTLAELDQWLAVYITAYHNQIHASLLRPPLAVWNEMAASPEQEFRHPADADAFYIDFLPVTKRMVRRDGIRFSNISYWDDVLCAWAAKSKRKFWVRFDPRNMGSVFVQDPDGRYWQIRTRRLGRPQATLAELKNARKALREKGRSEVDEAILFDALEAQRLIVGDAVSQTLSARRKQHRAKHALIKGLPRISVETLESPHPEPVSDGPAIPFDVEEWS